MPSLTKDHAAPASPDIVPAAEPEPSAITPSRVLSPGARLANTPVTKSSALAVAEVEAAQPAEAGAIVPRAPSAG